MKTRKKNKKLI